MKRKLIPGMMILLLSISYFLSAQTGIQWSKNFGGLKNDSAYAIKPTIDGGYIAAGQSSSVNGDVTGNHGGIDYWVAKLDAAGTIVWQKSLGGSGTDIAKSIIQTSDGGYIIAGKSNSKNGNVTDHGQSRHDGPGADDYDIPTNIYETWLVKLTGTGAISWTKSLHNIWVDGFDINYHENFSNSIVQTADGGYAVGGGGTKMVLYFGGYIKIRGAQLVKLTSTGLVSWTQIYDHYIEDISESPWEITSVIQSGTGYTMAGNGWNRSGGTNYEIFIRNVTSTGSYVWERTYGSTGDDYAATIQQTADGGYIVAGTADGTDRDFTGTGHHGGIYSWDYCLLRLNSTGMLSWAKCFGGFADDKAESLQQTPDGGYLIAGYANSGDGQVSGHTAGSSKDYWIAKVNSAGSFSWGKIFGGTGMDHAMSLEKCSDGGFIVAGTSASTDAGFVNKGATDYWLIKFQDCATIAAPTAAATQTFCAGAPVANLNATGAAGASIKWFTVRSGGIALRPSTVLTAGIYYVSQTFGTCEGSRTSVTVIINPTPLPPVAVNQSFCFAANPTVASLVATPSPGGTIKWYKGILGLMVLQPSTTALMSGTYYASQVVGICESAKTAITVTVTVCPALKRKSIGSLSSKSLYPNPASGKVTVNITTEDTSPDATIILVDMYGKILLHQTAVNNHGTIQKTIDLGKIASGVYIVKYIVGKESGEMKLVVSK